MNGVTSKSRPRPKVLAVASGGGHWVQLLRVRPAWSECDVAYATTDAGYRSDVCDPGGSPVRFYTFPDANRDEKFRLLAQSIRVMMIVLTERPDVVISTGASAGYFALRVGRLLGSRTVWLDSIANVDDISLAGQKVASFADLWLTQWPELAQRAGPGGRRPSFFGAVL